MTGNDFFPHDKAHSVPQFLLFYLFMLIFVLGFLLPSFCFIVFDLFAERLSIRLLLCPSQQSLHIPYLFEMRVLPKAVS